MLPLLKKPTDGFEGAGEFDKLFFILTLGIEALPDFGGVDLFRGEFNSTDCQNTLSLASQIQKLRIPLFPHSFQSFFTRVLLTPRFCKQHNKDLEQYPLAPTLMAYISTSQPLEFITDINGKYLLILCSYHFSIFSSQEQVNSISITFLAELE